MNVSARALGPRKSIADCARRSPGCASPDRGSIPRVSTVSRHALRARTDCQTSVKGVAHGSGRRLFVCPNAGARLWRSALGCEGVLASSACAASLCRTGLVLTPSPSLAIPRDPSPSQRLPLFRECRSPAASAVARRRHSVHVSGTRESPSAARAGRRVSERQTLAC